MKRKNGFTLIELMIVIAVIGILLAATFKLMGVASDARARAVTISRMEKLQNTLSNYHNSYGMYPAVPIYQNPNLSLIKHDSDTGEALTTSAGKARTCARAQPMAFEYPTPLMLDDPVEDEQYTTKLQSLVQDVNAISINALVDSLDPNKTSWEKYKAFKFGLVSFILPRVDVVGLPNSKQGPTLPVYVKGQWKFNNPTSRAEVEESVMEKLELQRGLEEGACKRWLPNLEKMLTGYKKNLYGIQIATGGGHGLVKRGNATLEGSGNTVYLAHNTVTDGWGNEFFYYSAPPHQSYRIWSAGPDGNTFPPWETITKQGEGWIKDDIVGGKL
jgi:prepilin-type N-terminal cleavage/methylation domain-containing protein